MYKDPDKQREAVKLATRRYRAKGITKVSQEQGITNKGITAPVESRSQATGEAGEPKKAEKAKISDIEANRLLAPILGPPDGFTAYLGDEPYRGGSGCECRMCANYHSKGKSVAFLNHGKPLDANELAKISPHARNRVALPGDADYKGVA